MHAALAFPAFAQNPLDPLLNYERNSGGRVGLYALNGATGASISWRAHERFVMCSTFKASLVACTLARVDQGKDRLDALVAYGPADLLEYAPIAKANLPKGSLTVEDMCKASIEISDNTCANLLLARMGGPQALTTFWRSLGDTVSRLDHNEPLLNRSMTGDPNDTTTPAAMVSNMQSFTLGDALSSGSRKRLIDWLIACQTGKNRLRSGLPKNWLIGDKTGNNGSDAAGDVAVAWNEKGNPVLISAYTQGGNPTPYQVDNLFTEIGIMIKNGL